MDGDVVVMSTIVTRQAPLQTMKIVLRRKKNWCRKRWSLLSSARVQWGNRIILSSPTCLTDQRKTGSTSTRKHQKRSSAATFHNQFMSSLLRNLCTWDCVALHERRMHLDITRLESGFSWGHNFNLKKWWFGDRQFCVSNSARNITQLVLLSIVLCNSILRK